MSNTSTLRGALVNFWYSAYRSGQKNDDGKELQDVDSLERYINQQIEKEIMNMHPDNCVKWDEPALCSCGIASIANKAQQERREQV